MIGAIRHASNWRMLAMAAAITAVALAVASFFRLTASGSRRLRRMNAAEGYFARAMISVAAVYFFVYSYLSIQRYQRFLCGSWDLAIFQTLFDNALAGKFFQDYRGAFDHLDLSLAFYLPFYAIWRDARMLLILQTAALALAVWPLYLLAKKVSGKASLAAAVGIVYLLYPLLSSGNLHDFHAVSLSPLFFFAMLLFMVRRQWGRYLVAMVLLLAVKETEAILVLGAGLYLLSRGEWKVGAITTAAAVAWVAIAVKLVLPAIAGEAFRHMGRYEGILSVVRWGFADPKGRVYAAAYVARVTAILVFVLAPMGFLALRRLRPFVLVFGPTFAAYVTSKVVFQNVLSGHYGLTATAAALGAAALALDEVKGFAEDEKPSALPLLLVTVATLANVAFSYPADCRKECPQARFELAKSMNVMSLPPRLGLVRTGFYGSVPQQNSLRAVTALLPEGSSVAVQNNVGYLLTKRCEIRDLDAAVEADFYVFAPEMNDGFTESGVYWGLYRRLMSDENVHLLFSINFVAGRRPEFVFFATGDNRDKFFANAREALARDPSNLYYAVVVREIARQMEEAEGSAS